MSNRPSRGERRLRLRFLGAVFFTLALLAIGTIGFSSMAGWSLSDAAYMTVITISAVGYAEIEPLRGGGRIFASVLIAGGIASMGVWFALITSTLVEMDLEHSFRRRRLMKRLEKLEDHVIVCGAGRTGRRAIKEIVASKVPYVAIEREPDHIELLWEMDENALVIEGDATRDERLIEAGIGRARGLVSALSTDTDNVFVCLTARHLNPRLMIVSRAYSEESVTKLEKAGADRVVSPNVTGGIHMASVLLRPSVTSFLDVVTGSEYMELVLEEVPVGGRSALAGHTLAEAAIPAKTGLLVVAIKHAAVGPDSFIYNPGPAENVRPGDLLIVLGQPRQIDGLRELLA